MKKNLILAGLEKNQLNYFYQLYNTDLSAVFVANSLTEIAEKKMLIPEINFLIIGTLLVEAEPNLIEEIVKNNLIKNEILIIGPHGSVSNEFLKENINEKVKFFAIDSLLELYKDFIFKEEDFLPICIECIEKTLELPCDFYIRLSDSKFIKVGNISSELSIKDINKYKSKNVNYFYVRKNDLPKVVNLIEFNEKKQELPRNPEGSIEKEVAIKFVTDELGKLVNPESKEALMIAGKNFNKMIDEVQRNPDGINYINQFLKGDSYHYSHTAALACLLTLMCNKVDWSVESVAEKMRMAALFHDISLGVDAKNEIAWFKMNSVDKIKQESKLNAFYQHPKKSADIFIALLPSYNDVEKIILEHHERPNGTGFPRGSNQQNINYLSTMFIVAENYINLVFGADLDNTLKNYALKVLEKKFSDGNFKKSFQALQKIVA